MKTRIKICGCTRVVDVQAAVNAGADAVGVILVPGSKRKVSLDQAAALLRAAPPFVSRVAVFQNPDAAEVETTLASGVVNLLQFHGEESNDFCNAFSVPFVKALSMQGDSDWRQIAAIYPDASGVLLDAHFPGTPGGQGVSFDWQQAGSSHTLPVILAGGLNPANVATAIKTVQPWAVDVSSGVENAPGIKDHDLLRQFCGEVKRVS